MKIVITVDSCGHRSAASDEPLGVVTGPILTKGRGPMSVYERHDEVIDTPTGAQVESTKTSRFAMGPGQILGGALGIVLTIFGVLAITRAGIDSTFNKPVVNVAGFAQSAAVGIAEVVLGLILIAGAASIWNRSLMGAVGGLMFIGGIVIAAASPKILADIGTTHRSGWLFLISGVIAMVAALLPVMVRTNHTRRTR